MIYSLTDKLRFSERPQIEIKGETLTINNGAENVLKMMDIINKEGETAGAVKVIDLLFNKTDKKKLDGLHLNMEDYIKVISTAISLAVGEDPDAESEE